MGAGDRLIIVAQLQSMGSPNQGVQDLIFGDCHFVTFVLKAAYPTNTSLKSCMFTVLLELGTMYVSSCKAEIEIKESRHIVYVVWPMSCFFKYQSHITIAFEV